MNLKFSTLFRVAFGLIVVSSPITAAIPGTQYAWYKVDAGLTSDGSGNITNWVNQTTGHDLDRIIGSPTTNTISRSGGGTVDVLSFDGNSSIWASAGDWGSVSGSRTVVMRCRLSGLSNGFLFDGSTNSGKTRAQVHSNMWQVGVQDTAASFGSADTDTTAITQNTWQTHIFTYTESAGNTQITHYIGTTQVGTHSVAVDTGLGGLILAQNGAGGSGLACEIAEVIVYSRELNSTERADAVSYLDGQWGDLIDSQFFSTIVRQGGDDGVASYRIPGLVTSNSGTLVAVFDIRHNNSGDLPGNIDVGVMRSIDGGFTWGPMITIMDFDENVAGSQGNGVGDPSILVNKNTGRIWVAALWSKGNNGWSGSGPGFTPDETGQFVLNYSDDDGVTWSSPVSITSQIKQSAWRLYFQGPGKGVCLRDGTLVFPAQYKDAGGTPRSNFIYSTDEGATWNNSAPAISSGNPLTTEAQIVERDNGDLLFSMRNHDGSKRRLWCVYSWDKASETIADGTWGTSWFDQTDPTVMGSLDRYSSTLDGRPFSALLFANPDSTSREKMSIRLSLDEGQTWLYKRKIDNRPAAYSCMSILPDGHIGIFYETGTSSSIAQMEFARFPLSWLVGDADMDGDQIPDFYEDVMGLDKNNGADAALDPDGDGVSSLDEYVARTDPLENTSVLVASVTPDGAGHLLSWSSVPSVSYKIETSPNLTIGSWATVPSMGNILANSITTSVILPVTLDARRFYRVVVK